MLWGVELMFFPCAEGAQCTYSYWGYFGALAGLLSACLAAKRRAFRKGAGRSLCAAVSTTIAPMQRWIFGWLVESEILYTST